MHLSIGIFGNNEFMKKLGKQGTINDIMIYNHASSEGVFSFLAPNSPENKIQSILQVINIIDIPIIVSDSITKELAEQIIFLDAFGFKKGFIISKSEDLKNIIKNTSLEKYEFIEDEKELREKLKECRPKEIVDRVWIPVDNYFNVKSVGTVVLCIVKGGTVKKHEKLILQPLNKEVLIKGIQSQDKDIDQAEAGMRAGLNIKGVEADEIKRGYVLCKDAVVSKKVNIEFSKSKYSKENLEKGLSVFFSLGLQIIPGRIEDDLSILLEHPAVFFPNQKFIIVSTKQTMPRIIGTGRMKQI